MIRGTKVILEIFGNTLVAAGPLYSSPRGWLPLGTACFLIRLKASPAWQEWNRFRWVIAVQTMIQGILRNRPDLQHFTSQVSHNLQLAIVPHPFGRSCPRHPTPAPSSQHLVPRRLHQEWPPKWMDIIHFHHVACALSMQGLAHVATIFLHLLTIDACLTNPKIMMLTRSMFHPYEMRRNQPGAGTWQC